MSSVADRTDLVAAVKADLVARGVDLAGDAGGFQITKRVAWQLRAAGGGLLDKQTGENVDGYAADIVAFPDGTIVDILGSCGTENRPQWLVDPPVDPSRWRAAVDPGDAPTPPPTPPPTPTPTPTDQVAAALEDVYRALDSLDATDAALVVAVRQLVDTIAQALKTGIAVHF